MRTTGRRERGAMAYHSGLAAEDRVAQDYERRGRSVACRRWRGQGGEIDIVTREGERVVFVEVKKSSSFERALALLRPRQIERLYAAAAEFLAGEPKGQLTELRFDLALVDEAGRVQIMENAFA